MKVRLDTIEVSDDERRALRRYRGLTGLATREDVRADLEGLIIDYLQGLDGELEQ